MSDLTIEQYSNEEYLNFQGPDALTTIDAEDVAVQIKHIIELPHVGNMTISHQRR